MSVATITDAPDRQTRVKDLVIALMRYADSPETCVYINVYEMIELKNEAGDITIDLNQNEVKD